MGVTEIGDALERLEKLTQDEGLDGDPWGRSCSSAHQRRGGVEKLCDRPTTHVFQLVTCTTLKRQWRN